jgi:hypothetical protein
LDFLSFLVGASTLSKIIENVEKPIGGKGMNISGCNRSAMLQFLMALILIVGGCLWTGCSDDEGGEGLGYIDPGLCADVSGTWSMALEVEGGWWGGVLSSIAELAQSDTCGITGTMALGPEILGYATRDSLFFSYGEPGVAPEERVQCALEIVNKYLMKGDYAAVDGSGVLNLYGPNPDCSGTVDLQVSPGLVPEFNWEPRCAASFMLVENDSGTDWWKVGNENENSISSGLTYGEAPLGTIPREARPLVAGRNYKVVLYRWLGEDDAYLMVAYTTFTP